MTALSPAAPRAGSTLRALLARRRPGMWRSAAHLGLGLSVGLLQWLVLAVLLLLSPVAWAWPRVFPGIARALRQLHDLERARFEAVLGVSELTRRREEWAGVTDPGFAGMIGYALLRAPVSAAQVGVVVLLLPLPAVTLWFAARSLPSGPTPLAWATVLFLLLMLASSWVALPLVADADRWLARTLLGGEVAELERRVETLTASRRQTVDEAERERGRLERDLHDGAQQRLIALSILLGRTEQRLARGESVEALDAVRAAKAETLGVIADIRRLTQGLRPAVLEARGLDAALSAVAARLGVPCAFDIRLDPRPPEAVEAALYFAIAELLTNVAKHSGARRASVSATRRGDRAIVTVADDGVGGATLGMGSGLTGIVDRLAGLDGTLELSSPPGGPTVASLEVLCAS